MRMVDAQPRDVGSAARRRIHQLDDRHLLGRRRQSDPPRHRYPHHRVRMVAPVITIASLMASPTRILVSWARIEWKVVGWYLPGAVSGAVVGSWILSFAGTYWLRLMVGLFLVSMPLQYRLGNRERSFPMPLPL